MTTTNSDAQLFEDTFKVDNLGEAKYDRVERVYCTSLDNTIKMILDVNKELFPSRAGDNLHVVVATTLALDGAKDEEKGWRDVAKGGDRDATLADMFDYVCYGKIYKFEDGKEGQSLKCYISFGGLLMSLDGPYKKLTPLRVDYVYLLVKR